MSNDNHTFLANANGTLTGTTSISTTVTAFKGTSSITPTIGTLPTVTGLTLSKSGTTITISATSSMASSGSFNIPITVDGKSFTKTFSYSKATNGNDGAPGYTVILTNESEIFNSDSTGYISTAITKTTQVLAYKGTTSITPTINALPTVTGLTLSKSGTTITIKANTGTSLADSGSFNISITVDGLSFNKTFSWTKVKNGKDGDATDLPAWITEWGTDIVTMNKTSILTPKLFAGTVSSGIPTGVAIGNNVFGTGSTYGTVTGIVGYKNGTKTYHFKDDGTMEMGSGDNYFKWDGSTMTIKGALTAKTGNIAGFTLSSTAIYKGTSSTSSTTAGVYIGTDGIRQYNSSNAYVNIKDGVLTCKSAEIHGNITGDTTLNIGSNLTQNGSTISAFAVAKNGDLKIGGYSAHVHSDGLRKGIAEITSIGTIYSCHKTNGNVYTQIQEGQILVQSMDVINGNDTKSIQMILGNGGITIGGMELAKDYLLPAGSEFRIDGQLYVLNTLSTDKAITIWTNAQAYRGVDTSGTETPLAHVGGDNISKFGFGSWDSKSDLVYNAGSEFMGGAKATLKAKGAVNLSCNNTKKEITFRYDSDGNYVFRANDQNRDIYLGTKNWQWKICYALNGCETGSDRTIKENIQYLHYDNINARTIKNNNITTKDCLDFITNDYLLATYNYISDNKKATKLSAIAQDIVVNADGSDNIIGQLVVNPKDSVDEEAVLTMNQTQLLNVAIGAIQSLNDKVKNLEAQIEELKNK